MLFAVDLKCLGLLGGIVGNLAAGSVEQGPQSSTGCYSQKTCPSICGLGNTGLVCQGPLDQET